MTPVMVDSNVLLDIATDDVTWAGWSGTSLERLADEAVLIINPLVYAEVSVGFPTIEEVEAALPADLYRRSRGGRRLPTAHSRCHAVSDVLSGPRMDRTVMFRGGARSETPVASSPGSSGS